MHPSSARQPSARTAFLSSRGLPRIRGARIRALGGSSADRPADWRPRDDERRRREHLKSKTPPHPSAQPTKTLP